MAPPEGPTAATITITETLELLDDHARAVADGIANGRYALWLGSGISMNSVPGLSGAVRNVLELLQAHADTSDPACVHHKALKAAIKIARLRKHELDALDLTKPVGEWANLEQILDNLVGRYSELLDIRLAGTKQDYLLWEGVDIKATYAAAAEPGSEHLCVAILALEGAVHEIPSANWDGLIETATQELAESPEQALHVIVLGEDFRDTSTAPRLLKFHGCAVLAAQDESRYRAALVGARSQITGWPEQDESKVMCNALKTLATERRTLMIGLSAQDTDIQNVFLKAKSLMPWTWPTTTPAYVFAEQEIGSDQQNLLRVVYREQYEQHGPEIEASALIQAYAEPLLVALVLAVLERKLTAYIAEARAPGIPQTERETLAHGISHIRHRVAERFEPDRLGATRRMIQAQSRALGMFRTGEEPAVTETVYRPLSNTPADRIAIDPELATSGLPGLATALGILGTGDAAGHWTLGVQPTGSKVPGALTITGGAGIDAAIHFAANAGAAIHQEKLPSVATDPGRTIMIHSTRPVTEAPRSPRGTFGRTGHATIRHIDMEALLDTCTSAAELEEHFRLAASI